MKLYHGSINDFSKFDTEHLSQGEGAQVHGWGLYFAEDKSVVKERYTNRLSKRNGVKWYEYTDFDGKTYRYEYANNKVSTVGDWSREFTAWLSVNNIDISDFLRDQLSFDTVDEIRADAERERKHLQDKLDKGLNPEVYTRYCGSCDAKTTVNSIDRFLNELKHWKTGTNFPKSVLYTVEIPDDLVFIEEDSNSIRSNKEVNIRIKKGIKECGFENDFREAIKDGATVYFAIKCCINWNSNTNDNSMKSASLWLEKYGINGIHYYGERDGSCYVIFNPNNVEIVEKE